jgi:hypothetical protein
MPEHAKFDTKATYCFVNGVKIQAFPSHNLAALRGRPDVSFALGDEGDHFPKNQQWGLREVLERYIGKSGAKILLISTPKQPGGLFDKIEHEEDSLYKKLFFHWKIGEDKIYDRAFIKKAQQNPIAFGREYELKYVGLEGNVIEEADIESACNFAQYFWPKISQNPEYFFGPTFYSSFGFDPGLGSSPFGMVVTKYIDKKIVVVHAKEYDRPSHKGMVKEAVILMNKFRSKEQNKAYVDGWNAGWIRALKEDIKEYTDYHKFAKDRMKRLVFSAKGMKVAPINFNEYGNKMLEHMRLLFEKNKIVIDRNKFPELVTSLRTAQIDDQTGKLDKDHTSFDNVFDAFRLNLINYRFKNLTQEF